jgi:type II secretory pathway pseudopilin PulG
MRSQHRQGYTWVELVVIICVILFLLALLLPAVQQTRGRMGAGSICRSNIRNLALAVTNSAVAKGAYPGYLNSLATGPAKFTNPATGESDAGEARVTWLVRVLPYLERTDIYNYNLYRNPDLARTGGVDPRMIYLDILVCPNAAASQQRSSMSPPPYDYAANTGRADVVASAGDEEHAGYPADWTTPCQLTAPGRRATIRVTQMWPSATGTAAPSARTSTTASGPFS